MCETSRDSWLKKNNLILLEFMHCMLHYTTEYRFTTEQFKHSCKEIAMVPDILLTVCHNGAFWLFALMATFLMQTCCKLASHAIYIIQ